MTTDEHPEFTVEQQRTFDVAALLLAGPLSLDGSVLRGELRGTAVPAAMTQADDEGVPTDVLGRVVTACRRLDLAEMKAFPEDLLLELERHPRTKATVEAAMSRAEKDDDVRLIGDFLSLIHKLLVLTRTVRSSA